MLRRSRDQTRKKKNWLGGGHADNLIGQRSRDRERSIIVWQRIDTFNYNNPFFQKRAKARGGAPMTATKISHVTKRITTPGIETEKQSALAEIQFRPKRYEKQCKRRKIGEG